MIGRTPLPPSDRRASARVPVEMWVEDLTDGAQIFRHAGNLSRGGVRLEPCIPIPMGTAVKLRLTLSETEPPLLLDGRVVSVSTQEEAELGMGVAFVQVPADAEARLAAFIASREADESAR